MKNKNRVEMVYDTLNMYLADLEDEEMDGFEAFENSLFKITLTLDANIHLWFKEHLIVSHSISGYGMCPWELMFLSEKLNTMMETFELIAGLKPVRKRAKKDGK